ncbi:43872_t:CDS:2, partial [Gigaspora margarita]
VAACGSAQLKVNRLTNGLVLIYGAERSARLGQCKPIKHYQLVLAFANNTTWISNSKDQMEKIMELAESFYFLNSIEINKKSKLIVLNSEKKRQENFLFLNNTKIFAKNKNNIMQFFGVWINI